MGTARIFMAPKFDERGTEMLFRDQRLMMTEMDKFIIARKMLSALINAILLFIKINFSTHSESWPKYNPTPIDRFNGHDSVRTNIPSIGPKSSSTGHNR